MEVQKQERSLLSDASEKPFRKRNYPKAYNGRRCFSADAEKEVPGKPIECSFKQNPDRQITEIFLSWRAFLGG